MRRTSLLATGLTLLGLAYATTAQADLVLSFDEASYSIDAPGGTTAVTLLLDQNSDGEQITPTNVLVSGAVTLNITDPSIANVLSEADFTGGPLWDDVGITLNASSIDISFLSLLGLDFEGGPLEIGTLVFTGLATGTTPIDVEELDNDTPDFLAFNLDTGQFTELDPPVPASSSITVGSVVPEPGTLAMGGITLLLGAFAGWRRRR
jgi:hypothetical protein